MKGVASANINLTGECAKNKSGNEKQNSPGLPHAGISTNFRDIQNFVGCRENLQEKLHKIGSFLESVGIFYNLSSD